MTLASLSGVSVSALPGGTRTAGESRSRARRHRWSWASARRGAGLSLLATALTWGYASAQVSLSEVLNDPSGSESDDEFVELRNDSDSLWVDLRNWRLGDQDEVDRIVDAGWGTRVPPGGLAVVLDASYFGRSTTYDSVRKSARIVTIDDRSFGRSGWSNRVSERVVLVAPDGQTVDSMTFHPSAGRAGYSWERGIDAATGAVVWQVSHVPGGTPGRANSIVRSPVARLQVEVAPDPFRDEVEIHCRLPVAPALLAVTVYDSEGRRVARLRDWDEVPLATTVHWDGRRDDGRACAPGLYVVLVQISHDGRVSSVRRVVARY